MTHVDVIWVRGRPQQLISRPCSAEQVYDAVSRWPAPVAGPQLQLPVGLTTLTARLPTLHTLPHPSAVTAPEQYAPNAASLVSRASSISAFLGRAMRAYYCLHANMPCRASEARYGPSYKPAHACQMMEHVCAALFLYAPSIPAS